MSRVSGIPCPSGLPSTLNYQTEGGYSGICSPVCTVTKLVLPLHLGGRDRQVYKANSRTVRTNRETVSREERKPRILFYVYYLNVVVLGLWVH